MTKYRSRLSRVLAGLLAPLLAVLVAIPVLAYTYRAPLTIVESNGTAYTMLPVMVTVDNDYLADNGYMLATALDTRVESLGGSAKPHMVVDDRTLTATVVPASSQTNLYYSMGNASLADMPIITGYGGYVTTADAAALELGSDFEVEQSAYIDVTPPDASTNHLVNKTDAFKSWFYGAGTMRSKIYTYTQEVAQASDVAGQAVYGANWYAQTFTTVKPFYLARIDVYLTRTLAPAGDFTVSLRATAAGMPTGADLTSASTSAAGIAAGPAWNSFVVDYQLSGGVQYAIVVRTPGGDAANYVSWRFDNANPYAGGQGDSSADSGATWGAFGGGANDFEFRAYSAPVVTAAVATDGEKIIKTRYISNRLLNTSFEDTNPPASWTSGVGAFARSIATQKYDSYSASLTRAGVDAYFYQAGAPVTTAGQVVTVGMWVWSGLPNTTDIAVVDNGGIGAAAISSQHTGTGTWEFLTATLTTVNNNAIILGRVRNSDTTSYFDGAIMSVSATLPNQYRNFNIYVGGAITGATSYDGGVAVADNANNYTWGQANVIHYADYYKLTVGGTLIAWYQPVTMIVGTTLPDRQGAAQDGTITWGANPAGIAVSLGGLVSSSQPAPGTATTSPTTDILPTVEPSDWFQSPDVSGALLTNPMRPFVTMVSDNTEFSEPQVWVWLGLAFVVGVLSASAKACRGHYLLCGIATCGAIVALAFWTVWPWWSLVFAAMAVFAGIIAERTTSV